MTCCKLPRARYCHRPGCRFAPDSLAGDVEMLAGLSVGDKVWFQGERQGYTVKARSDRYLICTKPFNPRHTVLYSIVDTELGIRGTDNLVFSFGYETDDACESNLRRLVAGQMEVSHRNHVYLYVDRTKVAA